MARALLRARVEKQKQAKPVRDQDGRRPTSSGRRHELSGRGGRTGGRPGSLRSGKCGALDRDELAPRSVRWTETAEAVRPRRGGERRIRGRSSEAGAAPCSTCKKGTAASSAEQTGPSSERSGWERAERSSRGDEDGQPSTARRHELAVVCGLARQSSTASTTAQRRSPSPRDRRDPGSSSSRSRARRVRHGHLPRPASLLPPLHAAQPRPRTRCRHRRRTGRAAPLLARRPRPAQRRLDRRGRQLLGLWRDVAHRREAPDPR